LRKYEIYATKIISFDSYSKELPNGIIYVAYTSYFVEKFNGQSLSQNVQWANKPI
jgi:hypothetical protein